LAALIGYFLLYAADSHLRTRRGPWEVTFLAESDGTPALRIAQTALGLSNIVVRFPGEHVDSSSNPLPRRIRFEQPMTPVPFGRVAFDDLMYQPGTVVLHCFGHEVQMLPRALFLDRIEHPWIDGRVFELKPEGKLPPAERGTR
jgi:hypothetical protein